MNRFQPNLHRTGRLLRAFLGGALLIGAIATYQVPLAAGMLALAGAFVLFEAWRGWCVVRACGIKTRY